jgi:hypothetical protein
MADFSSGVNAPGGVNYAAPLMNFSNFSNWAADDPYKKIFDQQQQQLNQQAIQKGQNQLDLSTTFKGGLPIDAATGQIDYKKAVSMLAQKGDIGALWNGADAMLSQSATNMSPLLAPSGGGQSAPAGGAPASIPARPLPPPPAGTPQGDTGSGTITDIVTDRMPNQDTSTGQTILKLSQVLGVDPNVPLTPGQLKRAQVLLNRYAPAAGGDGGDGAAPKPQTSDDGTGASFDSRFSAAGGGNLPPSANAVSPAPPTTPPRQAAGPAPAAGAPSPAPAQGAPQGAPVPAPGPQAVPPQPAPAGPQGGPGQPVPQAAPGQPVPQPQPQSAAPQGGPIVPQVPLPPGYTDPQQAILALRREAARLASNPRAKGQVDQLTNWAQRIEDSIKPVETRPGETMRDPRTGQVIFHEPFAKVPNPQQYALQRYLEQYPDATAEEIQKFNAQSRPARSAAAMSLQRYIEENPQATSADIQKFNAQQAGASAEERAVGQRAGSLAVAVQETHDTIPNVLALAEKNAGRGYATWNKIENKWKVEKGDEGFATYVQQLNSLVNLYGRVISGGGKGTVSDNEHAREMLNPNMPLSAVRGSMKGFVTEIGIAERAPAAVRERIRGGAGNEGSTNNAASSSQKSNTLQTTTPNGFNWSIAD